MALLRGIIGHIARARSPGRSLHCKFGTVVIVSESLNHVKGFVNSWMKDSTASINFVNSLGSGATRGFTSWIILNWLSYTTTNNLHSVNPPSFSLRRRIRIQPLDKFKSNGGTL